MAGSQGIIVDHMDNKDIKETVKPNKGDNPRVMIAAAGSGSGKTLITCALLEILRKSNLPTPPSNKKRTNGGKGW